MLENPMGNFEAPSKTHEIIKQMYTFLVEKILSFSPITCTTGVNPTWGGAESVCQSLRAKEAS